MTTVSLRSILIVAAQLCWLVLLAVTGDFVVLDVVPLLLVQAAAILLGLWAITTMGLHQLRIQPEVHPNARLVMSGPYRWIRHPMYTSVLLFTAAALAADFSYQRAVIWIALLLTMHFKLHYEERLLCHHFPGYERYREQSWRLVPWVY